MYLVRSGGRRDWRVCITLSLVVLMHSATVGEYHSFTTKLVQVYFHSQSIETFIAV